jgi:predicted dehydrogenase
MNEKIRIGMIGVNPERGWASAAHFPALALLPQYEVTALSTTRPASAGRAAEKFNVPLAFADHRELVSHPSVVSHKRLELFFPLFS